MSKPKMRVKGEKVVKTPPDKAVAKESAGKEENDGPVVKGKGAPDAKAQPPQEQWSDWIWSEERSLYYRAKKSSPETWKYEFTEPPSIQGISLTEPQTPRYISPKVEYKKNEEKVIYVKESIYEVPGTAGGNYILTKSEEIQVGGKAEAEKPRAAEEGKAPASKKAGAVDGRQEEKNKVDPAEKDEGGEKKQSEKEKDMKLKKKDKHGEKKDSKHKVRRK